MTVPTNAKIPSPQDPSHPSDNNQDLPVLAYLFADPAAHSLSPTLHNAALSYVGLQGQYQARRVPADELTNTIEQLRYSRALGANLSLPHKETVLPLLDEVLPAAKAIGAVNTIIHRNGHLAGDNTDAAGFWADLTAHNAPTDGIAVVLGAGGAARAAVWALQNLQQSPKRDVLICNRSYDKALLLAQQLGGQAVKNTEIPWTQVKLLINATSVGLDNTTQTPLPNWPNLHSQAFVYDMIYRPTQTRLLHEAKAASLPTANGLGMLIHQARLAFTAWTDYAVPTTVFTQALSSLFPTESVKPS